MILLLEPLPERTGEDRVSGYIITRLCGKFYPTAHEFLDMSEVWGCDDVEKLGFIWVGCT